MNPPAPQQAPDGAAALAHWGVIRARGADAGAFLHGQLTNDVQALDACRAVLAGYCSAKGRLLASFVVWRPAADEFLLACSADLLAATLKRLRMFVLRAKCQLDDATAEVPLTGLAGPAAAAWLGDAAPAAVWARTAHDGAGAIRLPDAAGAPRFLLPGPPPADLPALPLDAWRWLEVQSGVPTIEQATVDRFVPQMLNYEVLGGVDFRKGCYPGQEVVARSQYRGTLKRRSFLFEIDPEAGVAGSAPAVAVHAGQEVFHTADPAQPAGQVVNAAPWPQAAGGGLPATRWLALVELKFALLDAAGTLHLGAPGGPPLRQVPLPYALPLLAVDPA